MLKKLALGLHIPKGPGKRGHIVADTLLPTQMFPRLPARATSVADTNFVSATNVSQFAQPRKHHGQQCVHNIVSTTMCPRVPGPSYIVHKRESHSLICFSTSCLIPILKQNAALCLLFDSTWSLFDSLWHLLDFLSNSSHLHYYVRVIES